MAAASPGWLEKSEETIDFIIIIMTMIIITTIIITIYYWLNCFFEQSQ